MAAASQKTTDHAVICKGVEERNGAPATVQGTGSNDDAGVLRIVFTESGKESLEHISWADFFDKFARERGAFLYQDEPQNSKTSRCFKGVIATKAE